MNGKTLLISALALGGASLANALDLNTIAERLGGVDCYKANAAYEILLPNFNDPVIYSMILESQAPSDTLCPCRYLIDWTLKTPSGESEGFSAYFDGTHFRYRDAKMQEYHTQENLEVFAPGGNVGKGVQNVAQFTEFLPQFLARKFEEMAADSSYTYRITPNITHNGTEAVKISGNLSFSGYTATDFEYILDSKSFAPLHIELDNNPGQVGEQTVTINYTTTDFPESCRIDLQTLSSAKSEIFEKYRNNFFSLEQLPGQPLPGFKGRTVDGDRIIHRRGDTLKAPAIMVFLDGNVGSTPDVVKAVREAVDFLPMNVDVLWIFMDRRSEEVMPFIGKVRPGESVLLNAGNVARECGVGALTPVIIYVNTEGKVTDFTRGFNQDLQSIVIQKAGLSANR